MGAVVGDGVALLVADDRRAERALRGVDLEPASGVLHLAGAEQERLGLVVGVAGELVGHLHAGLDDAVVGRGLADLGAPQHVLELADPGLGLALLLAGGVVAAVLLEVALVAGGADPGDDLARGRGRAGCRARAWSLSKASCVSQMVFCSLLAWVTVGCSCAASGDRVRARACASAGRVQASGRVYQRPGPGAPIAHPRRSAGWRWPGGGAADQVDGGRLAARCAPCARERARSSGRRVDRHGRARPTMEWSAAKARSRQDASTSASRRTTVKRGGRRVLARRRRSRPARRSPAAGRGTSTTHASQASPATASTATAADDARGRRAARGRAVPLGQVGRQRRSPLQS